MKTSCISGIKYFLEGHSIDCQIYGNFILFKEHDFILNVTEGSVKTGEYKDNEEFAKNRIIRIYEDLWYTKGDIIKNRLLANLNRGGVIFARRCTVNVLDSHTASGFLESNHMLGSSKCRFRYGLYHKNQLVAVATFSQSRPMTRESVVLSSFEWVRYASLGSVRVVGGMGRLLDYFVKTIEPQEIMTYADIDWSNGDAYKKLGFKFVGQTEPIEFYVNKKSMQRVSLKKLRSDRKYRAPEFNKEDYTLIVNSGNLKFIRTFALL